MHLISPKELNQKHPLSHHALNFIGETRKTICNIFDKKDPRLLLIVGPCSIHNVEEALVYAQKFKELAIEVQESCFLVMRAYIEKPRTRKGWLGLVHDPYLNASHDVAHGLVVSRQFLVQLAEMGVPAATEFLTPHLVPYIEDLISWGCIGARTCTSQIHRQLASLLNMPIGFKNTVEGNVDSAINGIHAAQHSHSFMHMCELGKVHLAKSSGNPYAHLVLRGSKNHVNYNEDSILSILNLLRKEELSPRLLVDCSHGNCQGFYFQQAQVFQEVLRQIQKGNHQILGMMLESNLQAGTQIIQHESESLEWGVSVTDPCLDFATTANLVYSAASTVMSLTQS